ncbi:MAG: cytochrome c3 family protein [Coriobacteriales bacterium]|nr:cytochrome c3 family protein [Coriobacteriales bacterium]
MEEKRTGDEALSEKAGRLGRTRRNKAIIVFSVLAVLGAILIGCQPRTVGNLETDSGSNSSEQTTDAIVELANFQWSPETDCGICHAKEIETTKASLCPETGAAPNICMTCHVQESELATVHVDITTTENPKSSRLKVTTVDESTCLNCHGSYEELAVKSVDVDTLTDDNGLKINPHALPESGNHSAITCVSCHVKHGKSNAARRVCVGCHHQTIWECNTCHPYEYEKVEEQADADAPEA